MVSQEMADSQFAAQSDERTRPEAPRLVVDAMLGRLAKWLRLAGYDAAFWREGSDEALMAAAKEQGRLIVTKDHALAGRRGVKAVLLHSDGLDSQIREALAALAAHGPAPEPFTRCAECGALLAVLSHADAQGVVPPYVWHTQTEFRRCTGCGRVYWKGTHWPTVEGRLAGAAPDREGEAS